MLIAIHSGAALGVGEFGAVSPLAVHRRGAIGYYPRLPGIGIIIPSSDI
jgi:hypothetical protein